MVLVERFLGFFVSQGNDSHTDLATAPELRTTHNLSFSSQYYFLLFYVSCGLTFCLIALETYVRQKYSPLGDILFFVIVLVTLVICRVLEKVSPNFSVLSFAFITVFSGHNVGRQYHWNMASEIQRTKTN